jgi:hypothetical protein
MASSARRHQHQAARLLLRRVVLDQPLQHRQREGGGLAGGPPGPALALGEQQRNSLAAPGRRFLVSSALPLWRAARSIPGCRIHLSSFSHMFLKSSSRSVGDVPRRDALL